jgi:hypothetical protein
MSKLNLNKQLPAAPLGGFKVASDEKYQKDEIVKLISKG